MKRLLSTGMLIVFASVALGGLALAAEKAAAKPQAITGEIVDLGCYVGHGAKGAAHKECATKCIASGMPMGILTDKGVLYLLTMNHDNADPYNNAKGWASEQAKVTGVVSVRQGMKALQVDAAELVVASAK